MMGKLLGALVGRQISRGGGRSGVKGALMGAATAGILRRAGPLGLLAGGAWYAKKLFDRRKASRARAAAMAADVPPTV